MDNYHYQGLMIMVRATEKVVKFVRSASPRWTEAVELDLEIIGMAMTAVSNWMWTKKPTIFWLTCLVFPWMCFNFHD